MFRRRRAKPMTWAVVVAAPKGPAGEQWGDTWFATDLVEALTRAGEQARVVFRGGATVEAREYDDVVVVLRGLRRVVPRRGEATWMLWVISHPELVESDEPAQYDAVFAASEHWSRGQSDEFGVPVTALLQATNPTRFTPDEAVADTGDRLLFVGSTRGEFRPVVRDAIAADLDVAVYGVGWPAFLPVDRIRGEFIANDDLPGAYAAAGAVLNDHWADMAAEGFLSNRLFDAAACGARLVTDPATGLESVFGDVVRTYRGPADLAHLLGGDLDVTFPDRVARLHLAEQIGRLHSFDARAAVLIERARELRGSA